MKKNGYAETTIRATGKRLRYLQKNCNLQDPEDVKGYIANKTCSNGHKESLIESYNILMKSLNKTWNKPFYQRYYKMPKIPTTERLNMLIANASIRIALFLSMSKDLGTRPIELTWLQLKDVDLKTGIVTITSAKHCNGRTLKLTNKTLAMLKQFTNKKDLKQNDRIFPTTPEYISDSYRRIRNKLATKLQDPTIKQIRLYDFRHYYATNLYHKTKDLLLVKTALGHKDLRQTLRYIQLLETLENDEYHCKTATTIQEATNLIENGFEYVTEIDGLKLFRKRK
ncbi:MAG: tyrosine-type recombinase/integrase [Candidatus Bathyarchaeota archaeon]|nr:tyrosine-type recombinase/integrase [Candidatus Bathyarchaeota archaeon]MDH5662945.1 tyrosine-type recombinase/integrase [Candidatus Bathyarchaeota archaeon]